MKLNISQYSAIAVFLLLLGSSVTAGIESMMRTERRAQADVDRALALTVETCQQDRIDTDTIRTYRRNIQMEALRDTAFLALAVSDDERGGTRLKAGTGLTLVRLWKLSDQRAAGTLAALAALWLMLSLSLSGQRSSAVEGLALGNLTYVEATRSFYVGGTRIHLTPMQLTLMEMFLAAPDHRLTQREICDRLWPRKPDASATLYTLIRRLKPVLEEAGGLRIDCLRGEAYQLQVF